jgi:hypothetical protein
MLPSSLKMAFGYVFITMNTVMEAGLQNTRRNHKSLVLYNKTINMKNILITMILILGVQSLHAQSTPATTLANKIAQKMKDSLSLSETQKTQIYNLNMQLHDQKMSVRQQYAGNNLLTEKIQQVENTRDSLYTSVLSEQQFNLYRQKKRTILNNH